MDHIHHHQLDWLLGDFELDILLGGVEQNFHTCLCEHLLQSRFPLDGLELNLHAHLNLQMPSSLVLSTLSGKQVLGNYQIT